MPESVSMFRRARILKIAVSLLWATSGHAAELNLTIEDVRDANGQLMIAVQDSEAAFNGETPPVMSLLLPPRVGSVRFSTNALEPGEYAVRIMHDENGNGDLDANMVGMPTEPWGFSNNAVGSFGPPDWSAVRFTLEESGDITIKLNH